MIALALKEIEKYFGANRIFENITFEAQCGDYEHYKGKKNEVHKNKIEESSKEKKSKYKQNIQVQTSSNKQKEVRQLENQIQEIEEKLKEVINQMDNNKDQYDKLLVLEKIRIAIQEELESIMKVWLEIVD